MFRPLTPATKASSYAQMAEKPEINCRTSYRQLTEQLLLQHFATAALLVSSDGDILYLHGRTGRYLEPVQGDRQPNNIIKMAREGLQNQLSVALHKAALTKEITTSFGLSVKTNGDYTTVNLTIRPLVANPDMLHPLPLYLVVLEDAPELNPDQALRILASADTLIPEANPDNSDIHINALKQALRDKEEYLQTANEELETSNEELKSSNEEMQSVNEELQSTNEELETSKEELQSVNEELATVNNELQTKVLDLSRAVNDMNNLLAGSNIATIFVDHQKRIMRFTPSAAQISNLILSDVGRPVGHIVSNLVDYSGLAKDVQAVLDSLIPIEREVQALEGNWYELRIQPYRTTENVIEGAVITLMDITKMVNTREALFKANELHRLAVVVRDAKDAITVQDLKGQTLAWNPAAAQMYGWSEAEALQMNVQDRIPPALRKNALLKLARLSKAEIIKPYITERLCKDGTVRSVSITSTALVGDEGNVYAIATTERDSSLSHKRNAGRKNDYQG